MIQLPLKTAVYTTSATSERSEKADTKSSRLLRSRQPLILFNYDLLLLLSQPYFTLWLGSLFPRKLPLGAQTADFTSTDKKCHNIN